MAEKSKTNEDFFEQLEKRTIDAGLTPEELNKVSKDLIANVTAHFAEKKAAKDVEGVVLPNSTSPLELADLIVGDTHTKQPKDNPQKNKSSDEKADEKADKNDEEEKLDTER